MITGSFAILDCLDTILAAEYADYWLLSSSSAYYTRILPSYYSLPCGSAHSLNLFLTFSCLIYEQWLPGAPSEV